MRKLAAVIVLIIGIGADGALYSASAHAAAPEVAARHGHHHHHHPRGGMQPFPFIMGH